MWLVFAWPFYFCYKIIWTIYIYQHIFVLPFYLVWQLLTIISVSTFTFDAIIDMVRVRLPFCHLLLGLKNCTSWFLVRIRARPHCGAHPGLLRESRSSCLCLPSTGFTVCATTWARYSFSWYLGRNVSPYCVCDNVHPLLPSVFSLYWTSSVKWLSCACLSFFYLLWWGSWICKCIDHYSFSNHFSVHSFFSVLRTIQSSCLLNNLVWSHKSQRVLVYSVSFGSVALVCIASDSQYSGSLTYSAAANLLLNAYTCGLQIVVFFFFFLKFWIFYMVLLISLYFSTES